MLLTLYQMRLMCGMGVNEKFGDSSAGAGTVVAFCETEKKNLVQLKRTPRKIRSTRLGAVDLMVESAVSPTGERIVPEELRLFVPKGKSFAFDTIWDVTRMHFLEYKQREEIRASLPFPISTGSISNLYKEGLAYIRACHEGAADKLKEHYRRKDRLFILQIDGTNEGGVWTHFQVRDSVSGNVLYVKRISTENQADIEIILKEIEKRYGRPDAVISDMSGRGIAAVENLWNEDVPLFICQFHFLRDIGKDLLGTLHEDLRKSFSSCRLTASFNALRKKFAETAGGDEEHLSAIRLIDWILDYRRDLQGKGVPFDLAWKAYYERCQAADRHIKEIFAADQQIHDRPASKMLASIRKRLSKILENKTAVRRYNALNETNAVFAKIRRLFHSENTEQAPPLSRDANAADSDVLPPEELQKKIEDIANELEEQSKTLSQAQSDRYLKAAKQLNKYKTKLSNHIEIDGKLHPLPRTNNLCEISFREQKRTIRRTNGKKNLARVFDHTPAEIMYLQNLKDPDYCEIVFGNNPIHEAFAEVPQNKVAEILKTMNFTQSKKVVDPIVKEANFLLINKNHFIKQAG